MRIAIWGTGAVGRTLATALAGVGHDVTLGTRDVEATLGRGEADLSAWRAANAGVGLRSFGDAAADADVVVNATLGVTTVALAAAHAGALSGKVFLDVANPLDFSGGFPPTLSVKDTDSLAEQVQAAVPDARVVKSLNTVTAAVMVNPDLTSPQPTMFVSGDDADAKAVVRSLLTELRWRDVLDLGPLETARGTEMLLPLWLRTMAALGTGIFGFCVVHPAEGNLAGAPTPD